MADTTHNKEKETVSKKPAHSILGLILSGLVGLISMVALAWLLLILSIGVYQIFYGQLETQRLLTALLQADVNAIPSHAVLIKHYEVFEQTEKDILVQLLRSETLHAGWEKITQTAQGIHRDVLYEESQTAGFFEKIIHPIKTLGWLFLGIALAVTQLMGVRVFIFLVACPFFIGCVFLGVIDGLVKRDIRKFQGARESTFLFHRIKKTWKPLFFVPLFLYFVCPYPLTPTIFLAPMGISLGFMIQISLQSFKKYV